MAKGNCRNPVEKEKTSEYQVCFALLSYWCVNFRYCIIVVHFHYFPK